MSKTIVGFLAVGWLWGATLVAQRAVARPGPPPAVAWKVDGGSVGRPAVDSSFAFVLSDQHDVVAVDATSGLMRWKQNTGELGTVLGAGIVLAGSRVIAGDYNIVAYDRLTGTLQWRYTPFVGFGPGVYLGNVAGDTLFAGSGDGRVHAINLSTGTARWTAVAGEGQTIVYGPLADGDLVFAAYVTPTAPTTGGVVALDVSTGQERWRARFPTTAIGAGGASGPVAVDAVVVAASRDGVIYAFGRTTGLIAWTLPAITPVAVPGPFPIITQTPDIRGLIRAGRTLIASSFRGDVLAYDVDTRKQLWRYVGYQNGSTLPRMSSDARSVYVASLSGRLVALNLVNGAEQWRIGDGQNGFFGPPAVSNALVHATSTKGFYTLALP